MTDQLNIERYQVFAKTDCPFCKKAVNLLEKQNVKFSVTILDKDLELLDVIKNNYTHKTVPIVIAFVTDAEHMLIGGYSDLERFFKVDKKPDPNFLKFKSSLTRVENFHNNEQKKEQQDG